MPGVNVSVIGSNRPDSINGKLARALVRLADGSVEEVTALPFVSSGHNRSISVVLKNAIDWATRPHARNSSGGRALPSSARCREPSARQMAQQQLRPVLGDLGVLVMGGEAYVTFKPDLIAAARTVTDAGARRFLQSFVDQFAGFAARLTSTAHAAAA